MRTAAGCEDTMASNDPDVLERRLRLAPDVVMQQLADGGCALLDLATDRYYGLDATGARMVELATAQPRPADAVPRLTAEYETDEEQLTADLRALLQRMLEAGLVETDTSGSEDRGQRRSG